MLQLCDTKEFRIFDAVGCDVQHRSAASFMVNGPADNKDFMLKSKKCFQKHGFCIGKDLFSKELLKKAHSVISKLSRHLIRSYDSCGDEFSDIDQDEWFIVRMPRIGRGKHNIHFDPQFSPQHHAVADLMKEGRVAEILSNYWGNQYSLRESGFTMTRPMEEGECDEAKFSDDERELYHGGMEWHSDGAAGEATVLLSFTGISEDMGTVRVMPGSHHEYVDGVGFEEKILKARKEDLATRCVEYIYEPGTPLMFDSRTLHSVGNNVSNEWRILVWFIFDCY